MCVYCKDRKLPPPFHAFNDVNPFFLGFYIPDSHCLILSPKSFFFFLPSLYKHTRWNSGGVHISACLPCRGWKVFVSWSSCEAKTRTWKRKKTKEKKKIKKGAGISTAFNVLPADVSLVLFGVKNQSGNWAEYWSHILLCGCEVCVVCLSRGLGTARGKLKT